jgi:hypothetical protein
MEVNGMHTEKRFVFRKDFRKYEFFHSPQVGRYWVYYLLTPWRYSSCRTLAASRIVCQVSWQQILTGWGRQPHTQPSTLWTRVSLLVWHLPRNLSNMGGPTSSYAAYGIALVHCCTQAPHPATKPFRQDGDNFEGDWVYCLVPNAYVIKCIVSLFI